MKSYIDIVNTFKKICEQHQQVRTFTTGDIFEADLETQDVFTKVHLIETGASINKTTFTFTFDLLVMDLVNADGEDAEFTLNRTFLILADIYREFRTGSFSNTSAVTQSITMPESLSCEPFTDRFENLLSGWKGTFNITVQAQNSACESPMTR
tara:strand:+ start:353 stop:811 length:459 start_codon:yes stop_codon:yes gene_type:complete